jgi:hypothetical protein
VVYATVYVVPAVNVTGVDRFARCQPDADSPVNVTDPNRVLPLYSFPTWVPVFPEYL